MDWSCVDFLWNIVMFFISCLDSHSHGTHSLQMTYWWVSDVMIHLFKSFLMKMQTHLHLVYPETEWIFSKYTFLANYSFKSSYAINSSYNCFSVSESRILYRNVKYICNINICNNNNKNHHSLCGTPSNEFHNKQYCEGESICKY